MGISKPHHFKFYLKNNKPFVQTKNYARYSNCEPANGYQCLNELPERGLKPEFAKAEEAIKQEMRALEEFIKWKERCVLKLMQVERNLQVIDDTKWLLKYLNEVPKKSNLELWEQVSFWPESMESQNHVEREGNMNGLGGLQVGEDTANATTPSTILNHLPTVQERGYFGPRRHKPRNKSSKPTRKQRHVRTAHVTSLEETTSDPYPKFDPFNDVKVGHFVAMNNNIDDTRLGIPFYLGMVKATRNVSTKT